MNQSEKRIFLLRELLDEGGYAADIPANAESQRQLLRGLMNVRRARRAGAEFLRVQDDYLQSETAAKGVTDADEPHAIAVIGAKYDKKSVVFRIAFDTEMNLIGLDVRGK